MKPIAIIPARGGSKRIPRKNIADVGGKPMISYPIRAAIESQVFEKVIVSTEDPEIKSIVRKYGAEVCDRPKELAEDDVFEIDVYKQVISSLPSEPEFFCGIYATAIFIEPNDFAESYLEIKNSQADSLMSVSRYNIHPFKALEADLDGYLQMVHPQECLMRSQTYPDYVASNGTFYWLRTAQFLKEPAYYTSKLRGYIVPASRAIDIDEPEDLDLARALMAARN